MKIEDYKEMSNNVQVPDRVLEAYENALEEIRGNLVKTEKRHTGWKHFSILSKVAIIFGVLLIVSGGTFLSVKAYTFSAKEGVIIRPLSAKTVP